jgi:hypothetical protein
MKGNKILATLVVLAMVLSTMVVLNELDVKIVENAEATRGVDEWGYPTNTTTKNLVYHPTNQVDIVINTTGLTASTKYYLYYPVYGAVWSAGAYTYNLSWQNYGTTNIETDPVDPDGKTETLSDVVLNESGLWVLASAGKTPKGHNAENFTNTIDKWFWVNTSEDYSLSITPDEVYYGNNETINLLVEEGTDKVANAYVDVRRELTDAGITQSPFRTDSQGSASFSSNYLNRLTYAGNYTVIVYRDLDGSGEYDYGAESDGYNDTFGNWSYSDGIDPAANGAGWYNYSIVGPWDPPEQNSTYYSELLVVNPGVPITSIPSANQTMYWNFSGEVNISVENYDGKNISDLNIYIYNEDEVDVTENFTLDSVTTPGCTGNASNATAYRGFVKINSTSWGVANDSTSYGENGTWSAVLFYDIDKDGTDEWNTTVEFEVTTAPGVQWRWVDDDGAIAGGTNNDGEIQSVPSLAEQPVSIQFQVIGSDHTYYGDDATSDALAPKEMGKNITVSGDALFLSRKSLDELPGVSYSGGTWTVPLTPTMSLNGGEIAFSVSWSGYGTLDETLAIGGIYLNGTIVTISPTEFTVDENVTFTVTVTDAVNEGYGYTNAEVWLYWVADTNRTLFTGNEGIISYKAGGGTTSGEYTFFVNRSMQTDNQTAPYGDIKAPRNISAYVKLYRGGVLPSAYGYALTKMKPKKDLKVTMEPSTVMAGAKTDFYINTTVVDEEGNVTRKPAKSDLHVRIYNSTGHDVTTTIGTLSTSDMDGNAVKNATNEYIQGPGTYTIYAYNNTHDSEGNNGTLVVQPVDVTSSISEFIWNVDENISSTFTVTYNGEPVNGTLRIDNMTSKTSKGYNKTWELCNFTPNIGQTTGSDQAGENTSKQLTVTNGAVTVHNITANYLPTGDARKDVTFYFKPKTPSGSAWAKANGVVPVKIADVTASPATIPYNKAAEVEISVMGRGTGLDDVFVSIAVPGLSGETNTSTTGGGKATFAFTPQTTGNVVIKVENRTSSTRIRVTSWSLYLITPSSADEAGTFVVTVRNKTINGDAIEGATITFNGETYTTDSDGTATINSPTDIAVDSDFTVTATKEGYASASDEIKIIDKPKLEITIDQTAGDDGKYSSPVDVYVSDDDGNLITAATVTFGTQTLTTVNGKATITVDSETTGTIGATKTGFTAADDVSVTIKPAGIPGFELLTLIAAIGVAFILLRRRRH